MTSALIYQWIRSCICLTCEKLRRKTSAPAKKSFSIISLDDDAGPSVATCLVDLRHRCATDGTDATVETLGRAVLVTSPLAIVASNAENEVGDDRDRTPTGMTKLDAVVAKMDHAKIETLILLLLLLL
jgi:hypothetical protein